MKDFLKKYWYVLLVTIIFTVGIFYFIYAENKGKVSHKAVDGKDIIFSVNDVNYSADEFYQTLQPNYEMSLAAMRLERLVVEKAFDFSEADKQAAQSQAEQLLAGYRAQLGEERANALLLQTMRSLGYDSVADLKDYFLISEGARQNIKNYLNSHPEIFEKYSKETKARLVSHILVLAKDPKNPTAEEKEKMATIDKALETEDFGDVAVKYSEDTGSAANKGSLGDITTKNSRLMTNFLNKALELKAGEVSDWVETEYGFHRILVTATDYETLSQNPKFLNGILAFDPSLNGKAILELAKSLKIDFSANPEFEEQLYKHYHIDTKAGNK